jgi:dUTP pyrophosphatase
LHIKKGERVAQAIFEKYLLADGDDAEGERNGGIGSTGE